VNILVVGASRGTGALSVKVALARGYRVTAFARTPSKLDLEHERLTKVAGDFHDANAVRDAVAGHDAVIITASVSSLSDFKATPDYFSRGTRHCIEAMKELGVERLVVLSAQGAGESRASANLLLRIVAIDGFLRRAFRDHDVQERLTMESGLDWTIARPSRLTDGPALGRYTRDERPGGKVPGSISRADVADFLVEACASPELAGKAFLLGG
jgi:putative NADH-flavin reductase